MTEIQTPEWVKHAVFYQIFPDRFSKSSRVKNSEGTRFVDWDSTPTEKNFHGGDLYGVIERLDYLSDLGVNALYLNPIFSSTTNHRYNAYDYFIVDPLLGGDEAFRELIEKAHEKGIRIILDAVFNHTCRGFWQFSHILENGDKSPYIDWFIIYDWPLRPYSNDKDKPINYEAWWGYPELPKLNTDNPAVQEFIFDVVKHWMGFGIDGWRIDVPMEIKHPGFWERFRKIVKDENPEAYIVGEVWTEAHEWLKGDRFDGVMNYIFAKNAINFFGSKSNKLNEFSHDEFKIEPIDSNQFAKSIRDMVNLYDWNITCSQLNLLDSHDMPRALWLMGDDQTALKLAVLFQMTMPGAPCIYYGDEIGLSSGSDPYCRGTIPWGDTEKIDNELLSFYKEAIHLRNSNSVLRSGDFNEVFTDNGVYAFSRENNGEQALVVFNSNEHDIKIKFEGIGDQSIKKMWTYAGEKIEDINFDGTFEVKAREGTVIFLSGLEKHPPLFELQS